MQTGTEGCVEAQGGDAPAPRRAALGSQPVQCPRACVVADGQARPGPHRGGPAVCTGCFFPGLLALVHIVCRDHVWVGRLPPVCRGGCRNQTEGPPPTPGGGLATLRGRVCT